ncbi:hypothetical protein [Spiroplasma endosymbiont of Clivina fossor]|uniref:hypothetical protein n=1 Tax=Spiroplasma endosymbiont of Clivina fossor TaxID=3066282 RepID=UPI00313BB342
MFKLVIIFLLITVFSIFAFDEFLGLWRFVNEGLEYFNKVIVTNSEFLQLFKPMIRLFSQHPIFIILGTIGILSTIYFILRS